VAAVLDGLDRDDPSLVVDPVQHPVGRAPEAVGDHSWLDPDSSLDRKCPMRTMFEPYPVVRPENAKVRTERVDVRGGQGAPGAT
jgi:hypothetical protein